jgi:PAS domain S-box-containing protein
MSIHKALPGPVYKASFLHSSAAVIIFNVFGEILEANLAAENMFLYSREQVRGLSVVNFAVENLRGEIREGIKKFIESDKEEFSPLKPLFGERSDGSVFPINICVTRCVVGKTTYLILKVSEISTQELRMTKEIGKVAHEIRTPLNVLLGYLENYIEFSETLSDEQKAAYINKIRDQSHQLVDRVKMLLELAKSSTGKTTPKRDPILLKHIVQRAVDGLEEDIRAKGLSLEIEDCSSGSSVYADWELVVQILENLLTNAKKFTEIGGIIVICEDDDEEARIVVKDSGIGIPSDKLGSVFDEFFQVQKENSAYVNGLGVGLALSKKYAKLMGGDITVESVVDGGSTFTLHLPKRHEDSTKPLED